MTPRDNLHQKLMRDLATLKRSRIAEIYREVLDEAARKNSSTPVVENSEAVGSPAHPSEGEPSCF